MKKSLSLLLISVLVSLLVNTPWTLTVLQAATGSEPISPVQQMVKINAKKAELGKRLYFDPRLSKSGFISCNSCHNLSLGGTDNIATSIGHKWQQGPINAPTVLNSSYNIAQFWNGRAKDLKEQAGGPIANPKEMASTHELALEVLKSIPQYRKEFAQVYGSEEITIDRATGAIAEFENTLITPNSRFDQWLKGNKKAISAEELAGYNLFKSSGCVGCHNGVAVGGGSFQKLGVLKPYSTQNPAQGRFEVTQNEADKMVFKVPTLRNIELTYPYFHDGEVKTLKDAVSLMGQIQLGKEFSESEKSQLVAFLKTLTGDQPSFPLPILPPSNEKTPQPEPF